MLNFTKKILSDKIYLITVVLAIIAVIFGKVKISDINLHTIFSLTTLLITVAIYQELGILEYIADHILDKCNSTKKVFLVLILVAFFSSMLFTNDVAILALVPIFFHIKKHVELPSMITVSLLTIYANLGSAIMPFGNPQNIYLVAYYKLGINNFLEMSIKLGIIAFLTIFICTYFIKSKEVSIHLKTKLPIDNKKGIILLLATIIVIMGLLKIVPIIGSLLTILLVGIYLAKKAFSEVDYPIILIFINFFVIVGAIGRIDWIQHLITTHMDNSFEIFITSIITSQFISNSPATILLSKFTHTVYPLFLGVTIGGLGSSIASLANLLALRQYKKYSENDSGSKFFRTFTLWNFIFLFIFMVIGLILMLF